MGEFSEYAGQVDRLLQIKSGELTANQRAALENLQATLPLAEIDRKSRNIVRSLVTEAMHLNVLDSPIPELMRRFHPPKIKRFSVAS